MIFIQRDPEPAILQGKGESKQQALCAAYDAGKREFDFDSKIYGHETVKSALKQMQHDKCCFCESKITHISYGDVEHYRPKGGYQQTKQDELQMPGYYWLAYDWENLLLSCTLCNQQFKKNLFPLLNQETRAHSHHDDIGLEQPLLINPSITNPKQYVGFRQEMPYAIDGNIYGKTSIEFLGLNRSELEEERRTHLAQFKKLFDILNISKEHTNDPEWQAITNNIRQTLEEASAPDKPYSSMIHNLLHR